MVSSHLWGSLFLAMGAAVLAYGASLFVAKLRFVRHAVPATGMVVRREAEPNARSWRPACYFPVVAFDTAEGRQVVFRSPEILRDRACRVGTELEVLYDGARPERARIAAGRWYDVFMTLYLGALVSAAGAVLVIGLTPPSW